MFYIILRCFGKTGCYTTPWWRFMRISESCLNLREFMLCLMLMIEFNGEFCCFWNEIDLNWCWIRSRVSVFLSSSVSLLDLICNWMERESEICLLMWLWFYDPFFWFWHCVLFIACHVCLRANELVPCGFGQLAWHLWTELKKKD